MKSPFSVVTKKVGGQKEEREIFTKVHLQFDTVYSYKTTSYFRADGLGVFFVKWNDISLVFFIRKVLLRLLKNIYVTTTAPDWDMLSRKACIISVCSFC